MHTGAADSSARDEPGGHLDPDDNRARDFPRSALAEDQWAARAMLAKRVAAKAPNMVLASAYIPIDGAVAGYLLHRILSRGGKTGTQWHSVFVNSGVDAVGTVLKYVRNRTNRTQSGTSCRILALDLTGTIAHASGHAVPGLRSLVDDGMQIVADVSSFALRAADSWSAYLVVCDGLDDRERIRVRDVLAGRKSVVAYGALRDEAAFAQICATPPDRDIVFFGEVCVKGQIPCGTVSFTRSAFGLWNNLADSIAHISTFGGNGIAVEMLCDTLTERCPLDHRAAAVVDRIRHQPIVRRARLRMHANSWQTRNIDIGGVNLTFDKADGVSYISGDRRYVDLASGAGPAFRGHNMQSPDVIASIGGTGRETELLEKKLAALTGLPVMLPSISGASAVDNAILTALSARPGRGTVVTLHGNYSGKGPMSIAVSRTSPFLRELDHHPFRPYPVQIVEVPMDDLAMLRTTLRRTDIALVWMEAVFGADCLEIPEAVLDEIAQARESSGYLVGYDEIFSGFWRGDPGHFLASAAHGLPADLIAVSKGLSDSLVPIGATMVSARVLDDMIASAPAMASWLRSHYRSDFGAGLALAALEEVDGRASGAELVQALESMLANASRSPMFTGYRRVGLFGKLFVRRPPRIFGPLRRYLEDYFDVLISRILATRCGVILLGMRVLPCTAGGHDAELIRALDETGRYLAQLNRLRFLRTMVTSALHFAALETATILVSVRERLGDRKAK
ncbi:aminotransferase class III-fold pyridoxal phosphate-dependent enzyme [Nocardia sp. NPDC006044]|uniref:aminotransferase class III-fold pyridoxal phosphate-dependent enzyme n=1 Tax=Nocardia sp. NPDC006044 TaxID=3364306 RepID=UPI0036C24A87